MAANKTFTMIKPEAVASQNAGAIINMIEKAGFVVNAMKFTQLTYERAGDFYAVHQERPFYDSLRKYMSSGPIIAMILEKEDAVEDFRKNRPQAISCSWARASRESFGDEILNLLGTDLLKHLPVEGA